MAPMFFLLKLQGHLLNEVFKYVINCALGSFFVCVVQLVINSLSYFIIVVIQFSHAVHRKAKLEFVVFIVVVINFDKQLVLEAEKVKYGSTGWAQKMIVIVFIIDWYVAINELSANIAFVIIPS